MCSKSQHWERRQVVQGLLASQHGLLGEFQVSERAFLKAKGKWCLAALTSTHKSACVWTHMQMSHITKGRRRVESEPMGNGAEGWGQGWGKNTSTGTGSRKYQEAHGLTNASTLQLMKLPGTLHASALPGRALLFRQGAWALVETLSLSSHQNPPNSPTHSLNLPALSLQPQLARPGAS